MFGLDRLDMLFVIWSITLQIILIIHFAIRKPLWYVFGGLFLIGSTLNIRSH